VAFKKNSMKRIKNLGIIILALLLVACNNQGPSKKKNQQDVGNKSITSDPLQLQDSTKSINESLPDIKQNLAIWVYDVMADTIVQRKTVKKDTLTYKKLINLINTDYNNLVHIDFLRISDDTIFVTIKNPDYLTHQMGSSGANEFMISTTFTLTELSGISWVSFDFKEGDHATPGTYSRKYFWDWITEYKKLKK